MKVTIRDSTGNTVYCLWATTNIEAFEKLKDIFTYSIGGTMVAQDGSSVKYPSAEELQALENFTIGFRL